LNPAELCRAELDADAVAFMQKYGSNANDKDAFGKCVAIKAREQQ
jgi:hypothetical protein